jgi:hypothetical protein
MAKLLETVDFPTPPLPDPTAMILLTPGSELEPVEASPEEAGTLNIDLNAHLSRGLPRVDREWCDSPQRFFGVFLDPLSGPVFLLTAVSFSISHDFHEAK